MHEALCHTRDSPSHHNGASTLYTSFGNMVRNLCSDPRGTIHYEESCNSCSCILSSQGGGKIVFEKTKQRRTLLSAIFIIRLSLEGGLHRRDHPSLLR